MFYVKSENDWPDGSYFCKCLSCNKEYAGPKRSHICWTCKTENEKKWNNMSESEKTKAFEETKEMLKEFFPKK